MKIRIREVWLSVYISYKFIFYYVRIYISISTSEFTLYFTLIFAYRYWITWIYYYIYLYHASANNNIISCSSLYTRTYCLLKCISGGYRAAPYAIKNFDACKKIIFCFLLLLVDVYTNNLRTGAHKTSINLFACL